jgi:uncharacterized SAM-binding protein YcdF (DUF218 family)
MRYNTKTMTLIMRTIEFCLSPLGILTFLLVAGLVMTAFRKTSKSGRRMVWAGVWLVVLILMTPLTDLVVARLERPYPPVTQIDPQLGVRSVVVLSGWGRDHPALPITSRLWPDTTARMVEAVRVYRQIPGATLIVSGGVLRTGDRPIAEMMADVAMALGVPRADVVTERSSETTYENLVEVKKIVGTEPFVLVSSASHLWRATAVARKLGMKPVPAPAATWAAYRYPAGMTWKSWGWQVVADLVPSPSRLTYLQLAWHEYLGYGWYWVLRRV